jgi:hypothetical protein
MNLRERWEDRKPVARVAFFGARGPEQVDVYGFSVAGPDMLAMAVNRSNHLASVSVTTARLVYFVDTNPRHVRGPDADARVFLDPDMSFDVVTSTMRMIPSMSGVYEMMTDFAGGRVRALMGAGSIREMVPLHDLPDGFNFVTIEPERSCELWPELGHKR